MNKKIHESYSRYYTDKRQTKALLHLGIDKSVCDIMLRDGVDFPMIIGHDHDRFSERKDIHFRFSLPRVMEMYRIGAADPIHPAHHIFKDAMNLDILVTLLRAFIRGGEISVPKINQFFLNI